MSPWPDWARYRGGIGPGTSPWPGWVPQWQQQSRSGEDGDAVSAIKVLAGFLL